MDKAIKNPAPTAMGTGSKHSTERTIFSVAIVALDFGRRNTSRDHGEV